MTSPQAFDLLPDAASTLSGRVDALFWFLMVVSAFITLLVLVLIIYCAIRYRRRTEDEVPAETATHTWLEVGWTVATFLVMLVMFFWGTRLYIDMKRPAAAGAMEIHVVGKQWMWKIQHPEGQREIDELHIPVGRPVKLIMSSQDVIHSFGVPAFRIKQDVVPGSYSTQWFTATKPGRYHLFCQEYCGTLHSGMTGWVVVMEPQDYVAWLAGTPVGDNPVTAGAELFRTYGCAQCHGQTAPTLAGLYGQPVRLQDGSTVTANDDYLRESILNPPAKIVDGFTTFMPSYRGQLSEEQVGDLVAYIKSLASTNRLPEGVPNLPPARERGNQP